MPHTIIRLTIVLSLLLSVVFTINCSDDSTVPVVPEPSFWAEVNTGLTNHIVLAFAINSRGHVFAGLYAGTYAGTFYGGVFRSKNNGDSWTAVNTGLTNTYVQDLAINSSGHIFAGTDGGVFYSIESTE